MRVEGEWSWCEDHSADPFSWHGSIHYSYLTVCLQQVLFSVHASLPPSLPPSQLRLAEAHGLEPRELSPILISLARSHSDCRQFSQALLYYQRELELWKGNPREVRYLIELWKGNPVRSGTSLKEPTKLPCSYMFDHICMIVLLLGYRVSNCVVTLPFSIGVWYMDQHCLHT